MTGAGLRSSAVLLDAWGSAHAVPDVARGAAVLATASGLELEALVDVPLADLARLAARCLQESFDDALDVVLVCDACGERLDVAVPVALLPVAEQPTEPAATVRPPTTRDLLAAAGSADPAGTMLARCAAPADLLDDESRRRVADALDRAAGDALSALVCACPSCGAAVDGVLDVCALLWDAVDDAAPHLLREVASLAAAFGWTEPEILALPPARRAAYLDLVGA
ncbi:hypothetical protein [Cellulomonas sp. ICMP 17802]|uniref:hypothetical protein n=1 Tax=Cellulomonas sp. ICMP 17802 TaxID=3239199 RepID=UPI00351AD5B2